MKKITLLLVAITFIVMGAKAQVEPQAIGVRLGGGNFGGGAEINYQHALGDVNRLEFGLGLNSLNGSSYMNLSGVYQWTWELGEGFNWYAGPGAQLLLVKNASAILVGGQVGVEYNFNVNLDTPLMISMDTRPMVNLGDGDGFGWGIGLGIRYTF